MANKWAVSVCDWMASLCSHEKVALRFPGVSAASSFSFFIGHASLVICLVFLRCFLLGILDWETVRLTMGQPLGLNVGPHSHLELLMKAPETCSGLSIVFLLRTSDYKVRRASCQLSGKLMFRGLTWGLQDTGDGIDYAICGHDVNFRHGLLVDTHLVVFLGGKSN